MNESKLRAGRGIKLRIESAIKVKIECRPEIRIKSVTEMWGSPEIRIECEVSFRLRRLRTYRQPYGTREQHKKKPMTTRSCDHNYRQLQKPATGFVCTCSALFSRKAISPCTNIYRSIGI
ncbi:hypothetical protein EVAR_39713_1 [Eumeta japonica]|uniref:Uncharacterized protein n=1 Tax=Eumeta variegata TaxID=151549 RepID=A0A4C1W477_EUMVA|nr:hypothetical protein EVAR_39713_1 [Eumeta japonica]